MRIGAMIVLVMLAAAVAARAEVVNLVDGRSVQGKVLQRDATSVQIEVDGVPMTYYSDEIKDVDGKPFNADQTPQPAPADQPEVAATNAIEPIPVNQAVPADAEPNAPANPPAAVMNTPPVADVSPVNPPAAATNTPPVPDVASANPPAAATNTPPVPDVAPANPPAPATNAPSVPDAVPATPSEAAANAIPVPAPAAGTDKRALILKFIDVFGTRDALNNNFELMLKQIAKDKPDEAAKIRQRVKVDEIIERLVPIYDRNFTTADLQTFIAFYSSPEGRKLIATIPELMKESVQESVKYMEEKFPEVKQGE